MYIMFQVGVNQQLYDRACWCWMWCLRAGAKLSLTVDIK